MKRTGCSLLGSGQGVDILPNAGTYAAFGPWGVLFLYFSGLLIGGWTPWIEKYSIWFYAQAFNGPIAFATDFAQSALQHQWARNQDISWERTPSLETLAGGRPSD